MYKKAARKNIALWILCLALILIVPLILGGDPFESKKIVEKTIKSDMSDFIKGDFNEKYGVIKLSKTLLWIETDKIAEYSLTKNTEFCLVNCEAEGKVTLYSDGILFDDVKFKTLTGTDTTIKSSEYLIFDGYVDNYVDVPDKYKQVCETIPASINGTKEKKICYDAVDTYKKENQPIEKWNEYNDEVLKAGDYRWKIKGVKEIGQSVDFVPVINDIEFNEWAEWTSGFNVGLRKYFTFNETNAINGGWFNDSLNKSFGMYLGDLHRTNGVVGGAFGQMDSANDGDTGEALGVGSINIWLRDTGVTNDQYSFTSLPGGSWADGRIGVVVQGAGNWDIYYQDSSGVKLLRHQPRGSGWHMMTLLYNTTSVQQFWDGVSQKISTSGTRSVSDTGHLFFGDAGVGGDFDEMGIWNRTLTQTEITDLFANLTYKPTADTVISIPVSIIYPTNTTYTINVSQLNYTTSGTQNCWYSNSSGFWNSTTVPAGTNFSNVRSISKSNKWTVYCNDTLNNLNSSTVTFYIPPMQFNSGYPFVNSSFRITQFINRSGSNFTLGGNQYRLMGADSYYLTDYGTNHTYDDSGNEINQSRQYVLEILNEAKLLNINVIRTWANGQGGAGTTWIVNNSGGHHNLFEVGVPGNYSEEMFASLDWVISEASKRDIRLQLVLINNWNEYGGMRWYVQQSPTTDKTYQWVNDTSDANWDKFHDQFYNDTNTLIYYKNFINHTLNRNNTITGRLYKDEPAIFAWLLANEPRAKAADPTGTNQLIRNWTKNITAYIKNIDTNHLVGLGIEGFGDPFEGTDMLSVHNGTGVDFATFELHPSQWDWLAQRSENQTNAGWVIGGITSNVTLDWWTVGTGMSFNNRYEGGFVPNYKPALARHGY
jgi:hypothetical protein